MCSYYNLCISNTFFSTKPCHQVSWKHPSSGHWHQLDLTITRRSSLNSVLITRTYHSADCDSDHSLIISKVQLKPKQLHHSKQKSRPRINTVHTSLSLLQKRFAEAIDQALLAYPSNNAEERWSFLHDTIYNTAIDTFGKRARKNPDWFNSGVADMEPTIEAKRTALLQYKKSPSGKTLQALKLARSNCQRIARKCENNYWLNLCEDIQFAADFGSARTM